MRGRRSYAVVALGFLLVLSSSEAGVVSPEVPDFIGVTTSSVIRLNLNSPSAVYMRTTGTSLFGDMTRLNDGRYVAYRGSFTGYTPALFEIDPATGATSLLVESTSAAGRVVALTPLRDGNLFGYDNNLGFLSINPTTLAYATVRITASNTPGSISTGAMATSPGGDIYAWCSGRNVGEEIFSMLFRIDPLARTAEVIGGYEQVRSGEGFGALAFTPDGRLFGLTEINAGANQGPLQPNSIYHLNLETGLPTWLGQRSDLSFLRGGVFVPEPGSALCLAMAMVSLLACRSRRTYAPSASSRITG